MKYDEAVQIIHSGDVIAVAGRDLPSRIIQAYTGPWSHVGIAVWLEFGAAGAMLCILESVSIHGVRLVPLSLYLEKTSATVHWFRLKDPSLPRGIIVSAAMQELGRRYARPVQLPWSFGRVVGLIRRWLRLETVDLDDDRFFCSELVCHGLAAAGVPLPKHPAAMSPSDVCALPELIDMGPLEIDCE